VITRMRLLLPFILLTAASLPAAEVKPPPGMVAISGGSYKPLYAKAAKERTVGTFFMDVTQVTNAQFLNFVTKHPEWRRSQIQRGLADRNYLSHWAGDLDLGNDKLHNAPVTNVSWFAAKACCEASGKRLPTQDEWEFVARADATRLDASSDHAFLRQLLEWYSKPATSALEDVRNAIQNVYGLRGLHGLVWEWVSDFNSTFGADGSLDRKFFCGAGSLLATDVSNYAAFMRYAFRSSLKGTYCVGSLGFRGAKSLQETPPVAVTPQFPTLADLPGDWRTQDGKPMKLSGLRGKVQVLTMGFTRCKFACPRILGDMQRIERELGADADKVGFVFLSIDPLNDTPTQMSSILRERQMNTAHWTFLTATDDLVRQAAVALDFKYQVVDGFFAHSNLIVVLDENGRVIHREESLDADIQPIVEAVKKQLSKP
jgi:sulfatase modifying factor 1